MFCVTAEKLSPIAEKLSISRCINMGKENAEMAKAKEAKIPPTTEPTKINNNPSGVEKIVINDSANPSNGRKPKKTAKSNVADLIHNKTKNIIMTEAKKSCPAAVRGVSPSPAEILYNPTVITGHNIIAPAHNGKISHPRPVSIRMPKTDQTAMTAPKP